MDLTPEEIHQYSRHLVLENIGLQGQLKIKEAKVLVIGAGGLGCPILQYLTAAGVGNIGIVDDDVVEQSNLQRQILYTYKDINKSKAEVAEQRLQLLNPFIFFKSYKIRLTKANALSLFGNYDIIIDGTDNFSTRYLINDAAVISNKPVVFGSIFKFDGQVSVFNFQNGPTYRCLFPTPPNQNDVPNCSESGVLGVLPGIIGAIQANEVLKIICGIGTVLSGQLLTVNALNMQQTILAFKKSATAIIKDLDTAYEQNCNLEMKPHGITLKEINRQPEQYNLLDVREDDERALQHIGGQHIPLGQLKNRISEVFTDKALVVYCKSGARSQKAIKILKAHSATSKRLYYLKDVLI